MKFKLTFCLILVLCLANLTNHTYGQTSLFSANQYVSNNGDTLQYRQLISDYDSKSKYPLVIFLHGSGERGNDNKAQLKWGVQEFATSKNLTMHPSIIIAPQCPNEMSWASLDKENVTYLPSPTLPMQLLKELIDKSIQELPVDIDRIYITGLSMGGYGTYDAIMRYPKLFAAALPVCGGGDINKAEDIAHIPIWIVHGALDSVVKPELSQDMVIALTKAGGHPGYTQYPEAGHFSWIGAYSDPVIMNWLYSQSK